MSSIRLIIVSLVYHWRMHFAVSLGVVAGTAVLTGALLVGDSMRGSLRDLTLDRLGRIDEVLVTERFFRAELADDLARQPGFDEHFTRAVPAILIRASLERADPQSPARANQVNLIGCDERFWDLGSGRSDQLPASRQIVLNRPLADRLGAKVGDRIILRLPRITSIPADNPLGRKTDTVRSHGLTVQNIAPAEGLGRFTLRPSQQKPLNAYVPLQWLQGRLDRPGQANAILAAGPERDTKPPSEAHETVQDLLRPTLEDFGLRVEETAGGYFNITSDRMLLAPAAEDQILESLDGEDVQPALTYLANTIAHGDRGLPYSTITAVDFRPDTPLGPFVTSEGDTISSVGADEIVLNSWAAEDLQAKPGDTIRVTYFEPESTDGEVRERTNEFRLVAVAELAEAADDPDFTPEVPGVTDQLSMRQWDPPFPFDAKRIRDKDETYWEEHRATPKAFVSLATGRRLWESRFGRTTSLRIRPRKALTVESLTEQLQLDPARLGFSFQPVKRQGLDASEGTTPFNALFIGFSFFIIAAAVMLVALLFRLGVERRATEVGILTAVGLAAGQVSKLLIVEGFLVSAMASVFGVAAGVGYAALMLAGLRTLWLAAVVTPFLQLHVTGLSLAIGYASGVAVALAAVAWAVRRIGRVPPRRLLAGQAGEAGWLVPSRSRALVIASVSMLFAAAALGLGALGLSEQARAGAFFGAGAMVLSGCLALIWVSFRSGATGVAVAAGGGNLLRLAARNAARNPGRSTLSIGLVAAACFLIISVSAFRFDPTTQIPTLESGNGGFALVAESAQPIYQDLNSETGRKDLGMSDEAASALELANVFAVRVKLGEDASCLNLYQPSQPRILGVPDDFIRRGGFVFTAHRDGGAAEEANPWFFLDQESGPDRDGKPLVPVIIDDATAKYSLHLWKGVGQTLDIYNDRGEVVRLEIVGLLKNSVFQGTLLVAEDQLLRHFPEIDGYRFFLVESSPELTGAVQNTLERELGDYGFAAETTGRRLADFLAVQNTYLSTFQSLGGLGLLLGTFGLAAVQLRNVLERRRELALMQATGFRRGTLAWMVMLENGFLLFGGLGIGVVAALVAVLPHIVAGGATIPWTSLAVSMFAVLFVGLVAGLAAVRSTLRAPLLSALREE
jgi:ABC-type antimicrobial peptide transport system permease subunit